MLRYTLALPLAGLAFASQAAGIEGRWQTVDLASGKPRGEVSLNIRGQVLEGSISGGNPKPGESAQSVCTQCEGSLKNQRLLGMRIIWDMRQGEDGAWSGGRLLDPDTGSIYKAKLTLSADGQTLAVRGYIGLPALGQTTTWRRLPDPRK